MADVEKTTVTYSPDLKLQDEKLEYGPAHPDEPASPGELVTVEKGYTHVIAELPPAEARRILRKVDYHLVPLLALLYLVAFVDRSNIGNAKIAGMEKDLKLHGLQYNIAVSQIDR